AGRDDFLCPIFIQPADSGGILFADCFVRPEECAIQIDRSQSIWELCCRLNIVFHFSQIGYHRLVHFLLAKVPSSTIRKRRTVWGPTAQSLNHSSPNGSPKKNLVYGF